MIQYLTYQDNKIPVRITYRVLLQYQAAIGENIDQLENGDLSEIYDKMLTLLELAVNSACRALKIDNDWTRDQLEDVFEGNERVFFGYVADFGRQMATAAENPPPANRSQRRKAEQAK